MRRLLERSRQLEGTQRGSLCALQECSTMMYRHCCTTAWRNARPACLSCSIPPASGRDQASGGGAPWRARDNGGAEVQCSSAGQTSAFIYSSTLLSLLLDRASSSRCFCPARRRFACSSGKLSHGQHCRQDHLTAIADASH